MTALDIEKRIADLEREAESHEDDYRTTREPKWQLRMDRALIELAKARAELKQLNDAKSGED